MTTEDKKMSLKRLFYIRINFYFGLLIVLTAPSYRALGSVMIFTAIMLWVYRLFLRSWANGFQNKVLPKWEKFYENLISRALKGRAPIVITLSTVALLIIAFMGFGKSVADQRTKVEFFPDNEPNQIIVYIEYPQGTDINKTNQITKAIEKRVYDIINSDSYTDDDYNFLVEVLFQVGEGAEIQ